MRVFFTDALSIRSGLSSGYLQRAKAEDQVCATPEAAEWLPGVEVLPWEQFVLPPANLTLHGVWLPDDLFREHRSVLSKHHWREWL